MNFEPIGIYHSSASRPYEAARQPLDRVTTPGLVTLNAGFNFEQALEDLQGFERIWLIYHFHQNSHWKPKVLPPRGSDRKIGVFATRAPYRPNPIGISCVKLIEVKGRQLLVEGADLLNETPILDIKPYLPYADAFENSKVGWLEGTKKNNIDFSELAKNKIYFLKTKGLTELENFILNQLEYDATHSEKKRVQQEGTSYILAYRTWRIRFSYQEAESQVTVMDIFSGYSPSEIKDASDPYLDKDLHRSFIQSFTGLF